MGAAVALEPVVELHPVVCYRNEGKSELMKTMKDVRRGCGLCERMDIV